MEGIREWAAAICGTAVLCAAVSMLSPDSRQGKGLKMVLSVFFICVLLSPLSSLKGCRDELEDFVSPPSSADSSLLTLIEEQTAEAMERSVRELVAWQLADMDVQIEEIAVEMDISGDGCISIGQVVVVAGDADGGRLDEIERRLYERLGLNAKAVKVGDWNGT